MIIYNKYRGFEFVIEHWPESNHVCVTVINDYGIQRAYKSLLWTFPSALEYVRVTIDNAHTLPPDIDAWHKLLKTYDQVR